MNRSEDLHKKKFRLFIEDIMCLNEDEMRIYENDYGDGIDFDSVSGKGIVSAVLHQFVQANPTHIYLEMLVVNDMWNQIISERIDATKSNGIPYYWKRRIAADDTDRSYIMEL
jgi:hypothetical protein